MTKVDGVGVYGRYVISCKGEESYEMVERMKLQSEMIWAPGRMCENDIKEEAGKGLKCVNEQNQVKIQVTSILSREFPDVCIRV